MAEGQTRKAAATKPRPAKSTAAPAGNPRAARKQSPRALIRYGILVVALTAAILAGLWLVSHALLLIFAGILFAAFLDAMTGLIGRVVPWPRGVRLAIVCSVIGLVLIAAIVWGGTAIATQGSELASTLEGQINQVLAWLTDHGIKLPNDGGSGAAGAISQSGQAAPTLQAVLPDVGGMFGGAWTAINAVLGVLGDALVIIFLGLFLAAQPLVYRDACLLLVPPSHRDDLREILDECGETLRHWLVGQSVTMLLIGLCVWIGLLIVGVGPAFVLGLQAGLLAFVPTLGPLIAGIAILLAGLASGLWGVVGALAVYLLVQTLESYLLTPMIQKRAISVPPAFLFASQIILGLLFGLYGLALATPLVAVARVFILRLYVEPMDEDGAKASS